MKKYDVVIIGGGPAGLTAAVYASRANLSTVFIEKGAPGGKMVKTNTIENWTGDKVVKGPDLAMRMFEHAKAFDAEYKYGDVASIESKGKEEKIITLADGSIVNGRSIIIASGMTEKVPTSIDGIQKFENKGVSYCAICDGPIYKGKEMAIIGGGNSAIEEAIYVSSIAKKVYVFIRQESDLIAEKKIVDDLKAKDNVEIVWGEITKLNGTDHVESAEVIIDGKEATLDISAVFPYIGFAANSSFTGKVIETNELGFIKTNESMETNIENIFAVGDIRVKEIRQIATAVADGAIAGKLIANKL